MVSESSSEEARSRPKGFSTTTRSQEEGQEVVVEEVVLGLGLGGERGGVVAVAAEVAFAFAFAGDEEERAFPPLPTWEQCARTPRRARG